MTTKPHRYKSEFARRHFDRGYNHGRIEAGFEAVLTVLSARGIAVPEDIHARITECTDLDRLESLVKRAMTADSIDDIFG